MQEILGTLHNFEKNKLGKMFRIIGTAFISLWNYKSCCTLYSWTFVFFASDICTSSFRTNICQATQQGVYSCTCRGGEWHLGNCRSRKLWSDLRILESFMLSHRVSFLCFFLSCNLRFKLKKVSWHLGWVLHFTIHHP